MIIDKISYKELKEFASENGYCIALYTFSEEDKGYKLNDEKDNFEDDQDDDIWILEAQRLGKGTDFREVISDNKKYLFKLYNVFTPEGKRNIPNIIPVFPQNK